MWAILSSMQDEAPVADVLIRPRAVSIGGVDYPKEIFTNWSTDELFEIGVVPVQRQSRPEPLFFNANVSVVNGQPAEKRALEQLNVTPRPLETVKASLKQRINAIRDAKVIAGISWKKGTKTYQVETDPRSQATLTAIAARSGSLPSGFKWRMRDNMEVALDQAGVEALADAVLGHVYACFKASWDKKTEIDALATIEALQAYDLEAGWPATLE